jgi:hypothetical protein
MTHVRLLARRTATLAATLAALVLAVVGTASASSAVVTADTVSATSPNGLAYGKATIAFQSEGFVRWNDIYLNDRCPGDGVRATMKLYIRQYGNVVHVGTREDVGGCESDPFKGSAYWSSGGPIDYAGIRVCSDGGCSAIKWVMRP